MVILSQLLVIALLAAGGPEPTMDTPSGKRAAFEAPVQLMAGDRPMGSGRLYPSPAMLDVDGDKRADLVIGDLFGKLTVSRRGAGEAWGESKPLKGADGKQLKFHNW